MIALIQRVTEASVSVKGDCIAHIGPGLLALIGVQRDDLPAQVLRLLEKLLHYRVFSDDDGRMNRSLLETRGSLLLVSQFTLAAETKKGTRASFSSAAPPELARVLFEQLVKEARRQLPAVETGRFGAEMQVSLINDGPVTFWLEA